MTTPRPFRLAYLVSHPIQYQAPLLRRIAQEQDIDLHVMFGSDFSVRSYRDEGFGATIAWDVPLLDGYQHEFLPILRDRGTNTVNRGIFARLRGGGGELPMDALWVHGYHTINALHGMIAAKALDIPVLLRSDSWLGDRPRSLGTLLAKHAFFRLLRGLVSAVLPVGTLNASYWTNYLGTDVPQFLMPYAVDNQFFQERSRPDQANTAALIRELNLDPARQVILFASKLQARKRCSDLLSAYAHLCADRLASAATEPYLLIVGDGEERKALEAQAASLHLPHLRFCGFRNQSELPCFFALAHVFVLPAQHEPWGLIVNEVMNAACPVILSNDVGCYPDLVADGVEGCVYPVGNIAALTSSLHHVLDSPDRARTMGQSALKRITAWSFGEDLQALRSALHHLGGSSHLLPQ